MEYTVANQVVRAPGGQVVIGYTDLPSRLPTQASTLYSNNISKVRPGAGAAQGARLCRRPRRGALDTHFPLPRLCRPQPHSLLYPPSQFLLSMGPFTTGKKDEFVVDYDDEAVR